MNKKVLRTLEYDKIIKLLTDYAGTASGKELCRRLEPMTEPGKILSCVRQTADAESRIIEKGSVSFGGTCDIRASAKRLEIGSTLSASELLAIGRTLGAASRVKAYGRRGDDAAPADSLDGYFRSLEPLTPLRQEIERCILSEEEISDDASPGLRRIRRGIKTANDRIHTQLNSIINSSRTLLSDGVVTMRDGRYCVPVKMEYSRGFPGLVHDHSSSGSTVFIEPMAVVQLNNEIRELEIEERKEIEAILSNLSNEAAEHSEELVTDFEILTELDFIFARAMLGRSYKGTEPIFNDELKISIKQGRHPLLDPRTVVPIDVSLGIDFDLLVITGPNTGGKTVTLKTIGLLTLMGQSGLLIPAGINSRLSVFNEIFADIGDEQSIEQSLSTFSSHMTNIVNIFKHADKHSLVLVDELGAGTDPTEGAALAIAILDRLHRQGIRTAATTHYSELKVYALSTEGVQNASCEFDVATLRPTYRLLIGIPGKSNAFAISSRLGLPDDIIAEASASIGRQDKAFEDVIAELNEARKAVEAEKAEAELLRRRIEKQEKELAAKEEKVALQRDRLLQDSKAEARAILQQAKDLADQTIRDMRKHGMSVGRDIEEQRNSLRRSIDGMSTGIPAPVKQTSHHKRSIVVGDKVHVHSLNLDGTVEALANSKGELTVRCGVMHTQVKLTDLELIEESTATIEGKDAVSGAGRIKLSKSTQVSTELNLIGKTVDEAMPMLEKYLDDAYLAHLPKVRIIHGRGTGALRNAVRNHLRTSKLVASYRPGEFDEGGYGVTVAVMKET